MGKNLFAWDRTARATVGGVALVGLAVWRGAWSLDLFVRILLALGMLTTAAFGFDLLYGCTASPPAVVCGG